MKKLLFSLGLLVLLASTGHAQELFRSLTETLHAGVSANATGKTIKVEGWATVSVHVSGITTATVTFQVSNDAALGWHDLTCTKSSDGTSTSSLTANGAVSCPVSGYRFFKAPISGYSAGTITVKTVQTTAASRGGGGGGGGGGSGVASSIQSGTTLPGTCTVAGIYFDTDEAQNQRVNVCIATDTYAPLLEAEVDTLETVKSRGREITTAVSEATGVQIGDGTNKASMYWDSTLGWVNKPSPLGDSAWRCWTNFNCIVRDEEGDKTFLTINPDALGAGSGTLTMATSEQIVTSNLGVEFAESDTNPTCASGNYNLYADTSETKLKGCENGMARDVFSREFMLPLNPRGAATGAYESIVTNQPTDYYITVTDANTDAADFTFVVPARYAGATTATFRLTGVSKNASPSGNIDFDCAMTTFLPGTNTYTAHSTTGEVTALLTPATQNRPVAVTTAAHTINSGPLVAGEVVYGSCEVDATATTSAQLTDFRLKGWVLITLN